MGSLRDVYARKAISQIPRLLGNMDRNQFSPTYGCFHRDYWLDKTSDFPDAVRQFGVHALALVYKYDFPGNIYKGNKKILDCTVAALAYWAKIQHSDGSFDEFYPYERGWVGPSAFTTFASIDAYLLIKDEIDEDTEQKVLFAIRKAARFIGLGEFEEDHLANHHAMACLCLWKAYQLLKDEKIKKDYEKAWKTFLTYHNDEEGWSREYDGVDPGYLSATISFLGKLYQTNPDPEVLRVLKQSVEFSAYFVYPNGFYGGSIGSRNTLHFYPHGYEILAKEIPLAGVVADKMLEGLAEDKLVPPEIMSDRYVFYRVPEFLLAWLDYRERGASAAVLPFQQPDLNKYFRHAGIFVATFKHYYLIANLAKGGVTKCFDTKKNELVLNDCGIMGQLDNDTVITSQWMDDKFRKEVGETGFSVAGNLHLVPSNKLFTPLKNFIFRGGLITLGRIPAFSHLLKGRIRKMLILGQRAVPVRFKRTVAIKERELVITDELENLGHLKIKKLSFGDEFFIRYVPQSRYFQSQELNIAGESLTHEQIDELTRTHKHTQIQKVRLT
jgi:hypothetical protein